MKVFLKIVKFISYICAILISLLIVKLAIQGFQLIHYGIGENEHNITISTFLDALIFFTAGPSLIGVLILLVCLIIFFPRFIKYIKSLEKNMALCTKEVTLKLISFLIIVAILISTIIYIYLNIK